MTDAFAEIIAPLFQHMIAFRDGLHRGAQPSIASEKRALLKLLETAGKRAAAVPEQARDFELAKRALIYWIDEVLIDSGWEHASDWQHKVLEVEVYGPPRNAAVKFWEYADQAETQARYGKGKDPLEVFYLCAALGFRGRKCLDDAGFVNWFNQTHHVLKESLSESQSPERDDPWNLVPLTGGTLLVAVSLLFSVTALVTVFSFIAAIHWKS